MPEVGEHDGVARDGAQLVAQVLEDGRGYGPVVQRIDLQQAIAARDEGVLLRGRSLGIDGRAYVDARGRQSLQDKILERIVAEDRGEHDLGPCRAQVLGDDAGPADEIVPPLVENAEGRGLGLAADQGGAGIGIDDGVAGDVHREVRWRGDHRPQPVEGQAMGLHQQQQFLILQLGRGHLDEGRRGIDHVPRREDHLPAVGADHVLLRLGGGRKA